MAHVKGIYVPHWESADQLRARGIDPYKIEQFYRNSNFKWTEREILEFAGYRKPEPYPKGPKLSTKDYDVLLKLQNGVCFICHKPPKSRRLAVDHCHFTNQIRGLLCYMCNYTLGCWN